MFRQADETGGRIDLHCAGTKIPQQRARCRTGPAAVRKFRAREAPPFATRPNRSRRFTNKGDGNARHTTLNLIVLLPLKGVGIPRLASPSLPLTIGALDAGATTRVRVEFTVPASVKQLSISEIGIFRNVNGIPGAFLEIQTISP